MTWIIMNLIEDICKHKILSIMKNQVNWRRKINYLKKKEAKFRKHWNSSLILNETKTLQ